MNSYDLESAFYNRLAALAFTGETVKPDEIYTSGNSAFRRGTVLLGKPETIGFGNGVYARAEGFYQIDLYIPRATDNALKVLHLATDAHAQHFFPVNGRGLTLTAHQTAAHIQRHPNIRPFEREGTYLRQVLEIDFYVELPAAG